MVDGRRAYGPIHGWCQLGCAGGVAAFDLTCTDSVCHFPELHPYHQHRCLSRHEKRPSRVRGYSKTRSIGFGSTATTSAPDCSPQKCDLTEDVSLTQRARAAAALREGRRVVCDDALLDPLQPRCLEGVPRPCDVPVVVVEVPTPSTSASAATANVVP
jgi:hypothetical protein